MLILLRIILTSLWFYCIHLATRGDGLNASAGQLDAVFYLGATLLIGVPLAAVWTPFFAEFIYGPLTGVITNSTYYESSRWLHRLMMLAKGRGYRRLTLFFCVLNGVARPDDPLGFLIGLECARKGSLLEKLFAREVFRFENATNCARAQEVLARHGVDPGEHASPHVRLLLFGWTRLMAPDRPLIPIPKSAGPLPLRRNPRIKLFRLPRSTRSMMPPLPPGKKGTQRIPLIGDLVELPRDYVPPTS